MLTFEEINFWLREINPTKLESLWQKADRVRCEQVGDAVYLRGLIEISNICRRNCLYCGIRAGNPQPDRYRLTVSELMETAELAQRFGYGTIVIQSGEDFGVDAVEIADTIRQIKQRTGLAITLSLGERSEADYRIWFEAGANRYLLRFETSNHQLFDAIHPPMPGHEADSRLEILKILRNIGYEIGSGIMAGIPGQSWDDLARDIELFRELDLDMIGCGPFLPHPQTPLGQAFEIDSKTGLFKPGLLTEKQKQFYQQSGIPILDPDDQVVCDVNLPFKIIALARLVCPAANIPSTTAIATIDPRRGRLSGLSRGANIVMPNLTPTKYRAMYEIYPNKAASFESPEETHATAVRQIIELGRSIGQGSGTSPRFRQRTV